MIERFVSLNLNGIKVEDVHNYIHSHIIPRMWGVWKMDITTENVDTSLQAFKKAFRLSTLSLNTTLNWMKRLGMRYDTNRKTYYVDGHERDDVVASRNAFCIRYLHQYEPRCLRWVQLTQSEVDEITGIDLSRAHIYYKNDNIRFYELHIDYIDSVVEGNSVVPTMSVRAPSGSKPLELI